MAAATDSKEGLYFIGLIFVGLAIGGIVGVNQTKAYWMKFCAERQDIEECKLIETEPQKAIVALIKMGDEYGTHAAIPATPPKEEEKKSN